MLTFQKDDLDALLEQKGDQLLFFYTPMCGGCAKAREMIELVLDAHPKVSIAEMDLNYIPEYARIFEIESVPALAAVKDGEIVAKEYEINNVIDALEFITKFA
ncbi:thiol-disulfide oxidoreductase [Listeria floridensis FSL S10-1187]|uniref:Thiol-disulfide oxidoreductase n=1 Tax=Listeria floridensis FSL S10-1187 TaxID=1265817 RepID=A0ABP3AYE7_9LIST|nr:thioredoxin family protein [Listeria floridensis]EUJ31362.1 thiol-disulfide oxidoreductase [Listeria floridensis FSL S10-1187]